MNTLTSLPVDQEVRTDPELRGQQDGGSGEGFVNYYSK